MTPHLSVILVSALLSLTSPVFAKSGDLFPRPPELESDIHFWTRVYTEIDNEQGFIHDRHHLNVIYEITRIPTHLDRQTTKQRIKSRKKYYQRILLRLAKGKRKHLTKEERQVLKLWPQNVSNETLRTAAHHLRFQRGQANRFRQGLIRAGAYKPFILKTLDSLGLPQELAALPHVESSFTPTAYSHAGAAGLWQFTRPTGRRFLRIDHLVDERLDPFKATVAAARLLKYNYEVTGSWPLAITAYNHGANGMRRAKHTLGTSDMATILQRYKSPTFGFASRNFYVAFLAALDVDNKAKRYFGAFQPEKPEKSESIELPDYVPITALQRVLGMDQSTLEQSNPALRSAIWNGKKLVPQSYELRVPCTSSCNLAKTIAHLAPWERFEKQIPDRFHKVRRGQTLSSIAQRYKIKVHKLVELNELRNRHHIQVDQVLRLPFPATLQTALQKGRYRVQRGDTLSGIARRFRVTEEALVEANEIPNKHHIYAGQSLQIAQITFSLKPQSNRPASQEGYSTPKRLQERPRKKK